MGPAKGGGSLQASPVIRRIYSGEKRTSELIVRECALQRSTRHLNQFTLIHTEALTRHGVL